MRKILLVILMLTFSSCTVSGLLWNSKSYQEDFKNYFIDEDTNRVVLIGENHHPFSKRENYHYELDDRVENVVRDYNSNDEYRYVRRYFNCPNRSGNIKQVFELGYKTKNLRISLDYPQATGSEVFTRTMGITFDKNKLSEDEINFLHKINFMDTKDRVSVYQNCPMKMFRYSASKEIAKSYKLVPLDFEKDGEIWERNTPLQTTGKILLTPFALAADIILIPITVPYFIYNQIKESQTEHFCEGEFCGYNKIKKDSELNK